MAQDKLREVIFDVFGIASSLSLLAMTEMGVIASEAKQSYRNICGYA
jgi:hypothetical protein